MTKGGIALLLQDHRERDVFDLTYHSGQELFLLRFRGILTLKGGKTAFLTLVRHPEFTSSVHVLTDLRAVTEAQMDFGGMFVSVTSVLSDIRRFGTEARSVLLVGSDMHFGLARMLEQIVEALSQLRIRVVRSLPEAAAELQRPLEDLEELLRANVPDLPAGPAND